MLQNEEVPSVYSLAQQFAAAKEFIMDQNKLLSELKHQLLDFRQRELNLMEKVEV